MVPTCRDEGWKARPYERKVNPSRRGGPYPPEADLSAAGGLTPTGEEPIGALTASVGIACRTRSSDLENNDMRLSVIIPCLNGAKVIGGQLEVLANQRWSKPWELIISDNGSTDGTAAVVESYRERIPNLRLVDASDQRGQPHALNVGVRAAHSEAVAFCDADDEVGFGWVAAMGEALRRYDFVAGRFELTKLNPSWLQAGHVQERGLNQYRYPPFLPHAGSGNMGVKRAIHEAVGGFDESMPYLFDTDYCFKVQLAGTPLHFVPEAVLHTRVPCKINDIYRKALSNGEYNVVLYQRYRPLGMPKLSPKTGLRAWIGLLSWLPQIRNKKARADWVWGFGWRVGRLRGSIKYHIFAL